MHQSGTSRPSLPFARVVALAASLTIGLVACDSDDSSTTGPSNTTGSLAITVLEVGTSADANGLTILVDGVANAISAGQPLELANLAAGEVTLELSGLDAECRVLGSDSRTVRVVPGRTARAFFEVTCEEQLVLGRIASSFRGSAGQGDPPAGTVLTLQLGSPNALDGIAIGSDQVGVDFIADSTSDPDFDALVALLTDGSSDMIPFSSSLSGFGGSGGARDDFFLPDYASNADFIGASITSIVARLDSYDVSSFGPGSGYSYDIQYSVTLYGDPPTTVRSLGLIEGRVSGQTPIATPDSFAVVLELGIGTDATTGRVIANVFDALDFTGAVEGQRYFVGLNDDADFAALSEALTNGVEDCLAFRAGITGANVVTGGCVPESEIEQAGTGPDLLGATITGCRVTVERIQVGDELTRAVPGALLEYDFDYSIEFVGYAAPQTN